MDLERERKIADLCREAMDLPPAEVASWLQRECGGDEALCREVEDYLQSMELSSVSQGLGLIARIPEDDRDWSEEAMKDKLIGAYRIRAKLGEGGMGSVFLAQQTEPLRRQVAVKIVKRIREQARNPRNSAEVQAMALLSHPHIAQVYEVGTSAEGHLFFAMEYVPGEPLNQYCDRKRLSLEERLWLLVDVCRGVQHAHTEKILHRDLKPSNILVAEIDGKPVPKIIDFGTVISQNRPEFEDLSVLDGAGTPVYMSPEALHIFGSVELDARTDVYALGIMLFDLVTGLKPFTQEEMSMTRMLEKVAAEDLPWPSKRFAAIDPDRQAQFARLRGQDPGGLLCQLEGELDRISAKAIARNRDQRYVSVAELATDLETWLRRQIGPAQRPPIRKATTTRRPRFPVLTGMLALVVFVLAGVLISRRGAVRDARRAQAAAEQAARFLSDMLQTSTGTTPVRQILARSVDRLDNFNGEPLTRARLLHVLGSAYMETNDLDQARSLLEQSLALREAGLPTGHPDIGASLFDLGRLYLRQGRPDVALTYLDRARASHGPLAGATLPILVTMGRCYADLGRYQDQEATLAEAWKIAAANQAGDEATGRLLMQLAENHNRMGRYEESAACLYRALPGIERRGERTATAAALGLLGEAFRGLGRLEEAAAVLEDAVAGSRQATPSGDSAATAALPILAETRLDLQQLDQADAALAECGTLLANEDPASGPLRVRYLTALGRLLRLQQRLAEAERHTRGALALATSQFGPEDFRNTGPLHELALLHVARICPEEALALFQRELAVHEKTRPEHPARVSCLAEMAAVYLSLDRPAEARHCLNRASLLRERVCAPDSLPYRRLTALLEATREKI